MKGELEFQDIYSNFHKKIHRYLARLIGENEAEDVTQEVFLKIHGALSNFRGDSSLSTWIYRIATNAAVDYKRKSSTGMQQPVADPPDADDPRCEEDIAEDLSVTPDRQLIRRK